MVGAALAPGRAAVAVATGELKLLDDAAALGVSGTTPRLRVGVGVVLPLAMRGGGGRPGDRGGGRQRRRLPRPLRARLRPNLNGPMVVGEPGVGGGSESSGQAMTRKLQGDSGAR